MEAYLGIDVGSVTTKLAVLNEKYDIIAHAYLATQGSPIATVQQGLVKIKAQLPPETVISGVATTGSARYLAGVITGADLVKNEITSHAVATLHYYPNVQTIIEIGGQDSKFITLEDGGRVRDFAMNDRCAAGSGRFLEVVAARLGVDLSTLGDLSQHSRQAALISSMCVVFAETEIIGLLAEGIAPADIAAGVQNAIAQRVVTLAGRTVAPPVCFTGGVALQSGMVRALEAALSCAVCVSSLPQYTGALGAAILAGRQSRPGHLL